MRKRKVASAPSGTSSLTLTLGIAPNLRDSLKLLAQSRKASKSSGTPTFIQGIVDEAIVKLAALLKSGADIAFIPQPRSSPGRTSFRVSARAHRVAVQSSTTADVKLADYIRTALTLYVRNHTHEIYTEAKTPTHRGRK